MTTMYNALLILQLFFGPPAAESQDGESEVTMGAVQSSLLSDLRSDPSAPVEGPREASEVADDDHTDVYTGTGLTLARNLPLVLFINGELVFNPKIRQAILVEVVEIPVQDRQPFQLPVRAPRPSDVNQWNAGRICKSPICFSLWPPAPPAVQEDAVYRLCESGACHHGGNQESGNG